MPPSLLIADVGGTSSRWTLLTDGDDPRPVGTLPGFNPVSGDLEQWLTILRVDLLSDAGVQRADQLQVYGAGCGSADRQDRVATGLRRLWPNTTVHVQSDLLGAARALVREGKGLVLVLGTGMNAGYYDGAELKQPMPSLGYILGDEGSGADLGKTFLQAALMDELPAAVVERIFPDGLVREEVIQSTYRSPSAQAYLASFAQAISTMLDEPAIAAIVRSRFNLLTSRLSRFFSVEERHRVVATGSVAYVFQAVLKDCLREAGMDLSVVERDPLAGLVVYHRRHWR